LPPEASTPDADTRPQRNAKRIAHPGEGRLKEAVHAHTRSVALPGHRRVTYAEWSSGKGLPLLLLPDPDCPPDAVAGLPVSLADRYRVIAPLPQEDAGRLSEADLAALLKAVGWPAIVVAHRSRGGSACRVAAASPALVRALVLVETPLDAIGALDRPPRQPVLVLRGCRSTRFSHSDAVALYQMIPGGRLAELEGAGEWPSEMQPAAFDAALSWFLAASPSPEPSPSERAAPDA